MRLRKLLCNCMFFLFVAAMTAAAQQLAELKSLDLPTLQNRAESGDAAAQAELSDRYFTPPNFNRAQALVWARKAADQGNARGEFLMGLRFSGGREQADWYRKSADQGYADAEFALAVQLQHGMNGLCQNLPEAAGLLRKAAGQGSAQAEYALGDAYEFGKGVPRDVAEARTWYQRAADHNYPSARQALGALDSREEGAKPVGGSTEGQASGCALAYDASRVLADLGDPDAQHAIGDKEAYEGHYGEAIEWYRKAHNDYGVLQMTARLYDPNTDDVQSEIVRLYGSAVQSPSSSVDMNFTTMTAPLVLKTLEHAAELKIDPKGTNFPGDDKRDAELNKSCNGAKTKDDVVQGEQACWYLFTAHRQRVFGDLGNDANLRYLMTALLRGCGVYAPTEDKPYRGFTCGALGRVLYGLGNISAAEAVWEFAPGCYSRDERTGLPRNGCVQIMSGEYSNEFQSPNLRPYRTPVEAFQGEPERLARLMWRSCRTIHDRDSCAFLQSLGATVDMGVVREAENQEHDALQDYRAENRAKWDRTVAESEARRNTIFSALQSLPGGSDPNAVLNAGNQQAAAIRSIGNANAAGKQSTSTYSNATLY